MDKPNQHNLDSFRDYLQEHHDGNMAGLVEYLNYSIMVLHRNADRGVEPVAIDGVINGLMQLNGAFIRCLADQDARSDSMSIS
jgi:hypothetical protein